MGNTPVKCCKAVGGMTNGAVAKSAFTVIETIKNLTTVHDDIRRYVR